MLDTDVEDMQDNYIQDLNFDRMTRLTYNPMLSGRVRLLIWRLRIWIRRARRIAQEFGGQVARDARSFAPGGPGYEAARRRWILETSGWGRRLRPRLG